MIIKKYKTFKDLACDKKVYGNMINVSIYNKGNYDNKIKFIVFDILGLIKEIKNKANFKYDIYDPKIIILSRSLNINKISDFKIINEINNELKNDIFLYKCFIDETSNDKVINIEIECSEYLYSMFLLDKTLR